MFMLMAESPRQLLENLGVALDIIADTFAEFGLEVNLAQGKTEVVMQLFGACSRAFLRELRQPDNSLLLTTPRGRQVYIVDKYKHLGTIRDRSGHLAPDAKAKSDRCMKAFTPIAGNVLGNRDIYKDTRLALANSLCFSRFLFGTG